MDMSDSSCRQLSRLDVAFSVTRSFVASPPGRAMSYSPADLEAAFAVILAALEEGEDLAPFLQQFPPGARRSLVLMLQATLPATRAASTTPPPAPPAVAKPAGAPACGGSSGRRGVKLGGTGGS